MWGGGAATEKGDPGSQEAAVQGCREMPRAREQISTVTLKSSISSEGPREDGSDRMAHQGGPLS